MRQNHYDDDDCQVGKGRGDKPFIAFDRRRAKLSQVAAEAPFVAVVRARKAARKRPRKFLSRRRDLDANGMRGEESPPIRPSPPH